MRCKSPLLSPLSARRLLHAMVLTTKARRYRFLPQQRFSLGYQSHLFLIKRNNERLEGIDFALRMTILNCLAICAAVY